MSISPDKRPFVPPKPPLQGAEECPICHGVGHIAVSPESQGWTDLGGRRWQVPRTENGPPAIHTFKPGAMLLLRACACGKLMP